MAKTSNPSPKLLASLSIEVILATQRWVSRAMGYDPGAAGVALSVQPPGDGVAKVLAGVDFLAERLAAQQIYSKLGGRENVRVLGEESLASNPELDLAEEQGVVALLDMIDGTDLLLRGLANWCSAVLFFKPHSREILSSAIGIPDLGVFYAASDSRGAFFRAGSGEDMLLQDACSKVRTLSEASISFYGQKPKNYAKMASLSRLNDALQRLASEDARTRIYNLSGNPFMTRMIFGSVRIDAVFDVVGQYPHDVVPGAYIATHAGATLMGPDGKDIDLADALLRPGDPSKKIRYVLGATRELCNELRSLIFDPPDPSSTGSAASTEATTARSTG